MFARRNVPRLDDFVLSGSEEPRCAGGDGSDGAIMALENPALLRRRGVSKMKGHIRTVRRTVLVVA